MSSQEALNILDQLAAQVALTRAQHNSVSQALSVLAEAIKPKEAETPAE